MIYNYIINTNLYEATRLWPLHNPSTLEHYFLGSSLQADQSPSCSWNSLIGMAAIDPTMKLCQNLRPPTYRFLRVRSFLSFSLFHHQFSLTFMGYPNDHRPVVQRNCYAMLILTARIEPIAGLEFDWLRKSLLNGTHPDPANQIYLDVWMATTCLNMSKLIWLGCLYWFPRFPLVWILQIPNFDMPARDVIWRPHDRLPKNGCGACCASCVWVDIHLGVSENG